MLSAHTLQEVDLQSRGTIPLDLARLSRKAITAASASSNSRAAGLAPVVDAMEQRERALTAIRDALRHELACSTPPAELVDALRRPAGTPCPVHLTVDGRHTFTVVHPIGAASPDREMAVWQSIVRYVHGHAA